MGSGYEATAGPAYIMFSQTKWEKSVFPSRSIRELWAAVGGKASIDQQHAT